MDKVLVFDTHEEAYEQLVKPQSEKNLGSMLEFEKRYNAEKPEEVQYPNIWQGLELTYIVQLSFQSRRYYFEEVPGLTPAYYSHDALNGYKTIPKLVKAAKYHESTFNFSNIYPQAKVNTLFYTLAEKEIPIYTDEGKKAMSYDYLSSKEGKEELKEMPFMARLLLRYILWNFTKHKDDTSRGLSQSEREEFERLYFKEGQ